MNNLGDGGASQSTIVAMNDNGGTPVQAPVPGPANSVFDGILASHISALDSTTADQRDPVQRGRHHVGTPSTSGPILTRPNQILTTSIGITNAVAEVAASVFISWVEEIVPDSGQIYQQLWAAEATCFVVAGG